MVLTKQQLKDQQNKELKDMVSEIFKREKEVIIISIRKEFQEAVNELVSKYEEKISRLEVGVGEKEEKLNSMSVALTAATDKLHMAEEKLDNLEQYSRRSNIRIIGVEEAQNENVEETVLSTIEQYLAVKLDPGSIDRCHRVGKYVAGEEVCRPILVKFMSYKHKREVMVKKKLLKGKRLAIFEDLTKFRASLLRAAKQKFGKTGAWSYDGRICVSTDAGIEEIKSFDDLPDDLDLCDIIVTLGEEVYRGHKIVFATMSEYFSDMFDKDEPAANCEVHIDDISPIGFRSILQFFYTGEILITAVNLEELILTSKKLMIDSLEEALREALPTLLSPLTWVKIKSLAGSQMNEELYQICHSYSLKHFEEIIKTETFLQLSFCEVKELIADDQLVVWSDEEVYTAVINWVKRDLPNRGPNLSDLMFYVKFPLIDKSYMMKNVCREPLMRDNIECLKIMLEATEYHLGMQCEQASSRTQPRKSLKKYIFVTGGQCGIEHSNGTSECEIYNPRTSSWHAFSSMQCKRSQHGLVAFRRLLYAFGGYDGPVLSSVEYYDLQKYSWAMTTPLPSESYAHGVCSIDNSIYICGGRNGKGYLNCVNKFDPVTAAYMTSPPMTTSRSYFNMAVSDNCIYAFGGTTDGGQDLKSMEIFDPREGKWYEAPSKSILGVYQSVAVIDGYIYTCPSTGGCNWERFNIRRNAWEIISNTSNNQDHVNHDDGFLYMLGSCIESIQKYDPNINSVIQMPPMINKRDRISAVMMDSIEINDIIKFNDS